MAELQQIEQDLIKLLGQRITALAESNSTHTPEDTAAIAHLLAQARVPEFVWKSIVVSCAAAIATSPPPQIPARRVTVIGGRGKMGHFFVQQLSLAGHNVKILEQDDWQNGDRLLGEANLVLICVPTEHTLAVIEKAAPYLTSSTTLADTTSIKTPIVKAMLKHHAGPVLSLHPMFGPGVQSFLSQNVVVCSGRRQDAFQWFLDLIESRGGKLVTCTPEEHDQMMVTIQAIRHFSTFSLGVFLAEEGVDISRSLDFSSPPYRLKIDLISRLFSQDMSLYLGIMLTQEDHRQAIERLANTYTRLAQLVIQKDQATLRQEFESARRVFQQEETRALKESTHVIDSLSLLLAANQVKGQETTPPTPHSNIKKDCYTGPNRLPMAVEHE